MSFKIEDGQGSGTLVGVGDNRLEVSARENPRIAYVSRDEGESFTWTHSYDHDAADTILLVSNSATSKNLHIHMVMISADTSTQWTLHSPAYPTLAGTVVTGVNTNRTSGKTAESEGYGDETGNSQGPILSEGFVVGNATVMLPVHGSIILGYHDCIAVDLVTAGTMGAVMIGGYYE